MVKNLPITVPHKSKAIIESIIYSSPSYPSKINNIATGNSETPNKSHSTLIIYTDVSNVVFFTF